MNVSMSEYNARPHTLRELFQDLKMAGVTEVHVSVALMHPATDIRPATDAYQRLNNAVTSPPPGLTVLVGTLECHDPAPPSRWWLCLTGDLRSSKPPYPVTFVIWLTDLPEIEEEVSNLFYSEYLRRLGAINDTKARCEFEAKQAADKVRRDYTPVIVEQLNTIEELEQFVEEKMGEMPIKVNLAFRR